jgi:hypothetical protein
MTILKMLRLNPGTLTLGAKTHAEDQEQYSQKGATTFSITTLSIATEILTLSTTTLSI